VFSQRRKTILNSLSFFFPDKDLLRQLGNKYAIDLQKRPEDLTIDEYVTLAKVITPIMSA